MKHPAKAHVALARSQRPQSFGEVIAQDAVTKVLRASIARKRLAQAILFAGPRGVGKTSLARILAKSLNCATGVTPEPCSECEPCVRIEKGTHADVLEIDAASNRSIEDVRALREIVRLPPYQARNRVIILDEVHMLTPEAFNALLKSLEEPAPNTYFILATTEAEKIPQTIVSRCQRFYLSPIPYGRLVERLETLAHDMGLPLPPEILSRVAFRAQGSLRDGFMLLEEVLDLVGAGGSIEEALALLGFEKEEAVASLGERIAEHDAMGALKELQGLMEKGGDPGGFYESFVLLLRNLLAWSLTKDRSVLVGEPNLDVIERLSVKFSVEQLTDLLQMFLEGESVLGRSKNPRLVLETLLVRASFVPNIASLSTLLKKIEGLGSTLHPIPQGEPREGQEFPALPEGMDGKNGNMGGQKGPKEASSQEHKTLEGFLAVLEKTRPLLAQRLQTLGCLKLEGTTVLFQPKQDGRYLDVAVQGKSLQEIEAALEAYFERKLAFRVLRIPQSEPNEDEESALNGSDEKPLEFEEALSLTVELFKAEVLEDQEGQEEMLHEEP